ncbi:MAG: TonB-dependent receptor [Dokdonia sp.]|nr:TonB-dependent receptor [Dokdonia sp.]
MKRHILVFLLFLCLSIGSLNAQIDSLNVLPEVVLSDVKLRNFSQGQLVNTIKDSVLQNSTTALTDVLRFNSLIYFRENGPGGVSSPSFRGTSAQQTAVVWNGININSQLNGQTDFNTISSRNYDNVAVRRGGGSIPYGSGAVGGSIHLNNDINFQKTFDTNVSIGYGSFESAATNIKSTYGSQKFYSDIAVDYVQSENDFDYLGTERQNENGEFENINLNANVGVVLSPKQVLKFYHNTFLGDRNFSGTLTAPSTSGYEDRNTRSLAEWAVLGNQYTSKVKVAHVYEQFRFFTNAENKDNFSFGKAIRYTGQYDFTYRFKGNKSLKTILDYTTVVGSGTNIQKERLNTFVGIALWRDKVNTNFEYNVQLRQDATDTFKSPLLASGGAFYTLPWKEDSQDQKFYRISINGSRNYRIPTFNDLYWQGAGATGNTNLQPETSWQADLGHMIQLNDWQWNLNTFYIRTSDFIKWQPNNAGIWTPVNVDEVVNYGAEVSLNYTRHLGEHNLQWQLNYGFTKAVDVATKNQLIYVPEHKVTVGVSHQWKWLNMRYQMLYNDAVFTTTDESRSLKGYMVANLAANIRLLKTDKQQMTFSLQAKNIFNTNYQTIAFRPNPGRNFLIQTIYTF